MNFIYDIVLNFNKEFYDFFEWNRKDNVVNVKKIPFFLVDNDTFRMMKYDKVVVDASFIESIKDKTFTYSRCKLGPACLITNGKEVIGVLFNDEGGLVKRSSLILDEEEEVLDEVDREDIYKLKIIKCQKVKYENINRIEKEKKEYLIRYINKEKNELNLKYLYYDYFEREVSDVDKIRGDLIREIRENWNKKCDSLIETVKIFSKIRN